MIKERIRWHCIAKDQAELSARMRGKDLLRIQVNNVPICIVRRDDSLHAIGDKCPHQGASLAGGWCEDDKVVCPLHRYRFDPASGKGYDGEGEKVATYPLEQRNDGLCLGMEYATISLFGLDLW